MGDNHNRPSEQADDHHLSMQRFFLPIGAREGSVALQAVTKLAEEKARRVTAERKLEQLQRSSAVVMKTLGEMPGTALGASLPNSLEKLRRRQLEIEHRSAELAKRTEELTELESYLAEQFAALDNARKGKLETPGREEVVRELVHELREQEVLRPGGEQAQGGAAGKGRGRPVSRPSQGEPTSPIEDTNDTFTGMDIGSLDEATIVRLCVESILKKGESASHRADYPLDEFRPGEARETGPWLSRMVGELNGGDPPKVLVTLTVSEGEQPGREELVRSLEAARAEAAQLASALQLLRAENESQRKASQESLARRRDLEHTLALVRINMKRITAVVRAKRNAVEALRQELVDQRRRWEESDNRFKGLAAQDLALRKELEAMRPSRDALQRQAEELKQNLDRAQKALWLQEIATQSAEGALELTQAQLDSAVAARLLAEGEACRLEERRRAVELRLDASERNRALSDEARAALEAELRQASERASAARVAEREAQLKARKKQADLTRVRRALRMARDGRDRDQAHIGQLERNLSRLKAARSFGEKDQAKPLAVVLEIRSLADSLERANEVAIREIHERLDRDALERRDLELRVRLATRPPGAARRYATRAVAATTVVWTKARRPFTCFGGSLRRGMQSATSAVRAALPKGPLLLVAALRRIRQAGGRLRAKLPHNRTP